MRAFNWDLEDISFKYDVDELVFKRLSFLEKLFGYLDPWMLKLFKTRLLLLNPINFWPNLDKIRFIQSSWHDYNLLKY